MFGRDLREVLQLELDFVDGGGYGRSVHEPRFPRMVFRDSPTCLNLDDPSQTFPCTRCALYGFVPEGQRSEKIPCHHIPLTPDGKTIKSMLETAEESTIHETLAAWLRSTLTALQQPEVGKNTLFQGFEET
jgi:hypothetical protein